MNIEHFEYYNLYSISTSNMSNDAVITSVIRFHRIYPWLLFPFGFIGSLLTILIFTRKKFQKFGCSILFVAESVMVNSRVWLTFKIKYTYSVSLGFDTDHIELRSPYDPLLVSIILSPTFDLSLSNIQIHHELFFTLCSLDLVCHITRTCSCDETICLESKCLQS